MKKVLVAPLDWGLGHATRCVPVINELLKDDCEVMIGGSGDSLTLLKLEFPQLRFFSLPSYAPAYQSSGAMALKIALQIPKFLVAIRGEHKRLQQIIKAEGIDLVISDHRYGCWSPMIPSVFITHQYVILPPQGYLWTAGLVNRVHQRMIRRFSMCWIPDLPGEANLAGILSGPDAHKNDEFVCYLGYLSRFKAPRPSVKQFDVVCLLSGPEPQRSVIERQLVSQLVVSGLKYFVVRGLPSNHGEPMENSVNFAQGDALESILSAADVVIARSGYSTVMDLARLGKKAIFIPTPGQPEQEYLAQRLMKNQIAYTSGQQNFNFAAAWDASAGYRGFQPTPGSASLLSDAIRRVFMLNGNRNK
jgi:predicted glycosyltransferase